MNSDRKKPAAVPAAPSLQYTDTAYLTLASVICACSVVFLHANNAYWTFSATERYWWTGNIIDGIFYFAVPVFFMITGSTLLDFYKRYDIGTYFKKRVTKTVIPYLFWSLFGLGLQIYYLETIDPAEVDWIYIANGLSDGSLVAGYWFFPTLFGVYLSIPLFAAVSEDMRKRVFTYVSVTAFIVCILKSFLEDIFESPVLVPLSITVGSGYLFFIVTGYLISHYEIPGRLRKVIYGLGIAGLMMDIVGTYLWSMEAGSVDRTFKGYTNVPSVLYATAAFVFFRQNGNRILEIPWIRKIVGFLGGYTFSIYLLHRFIIWVVTDWFSMDIFRLRYRLLMPFPVIAIAVAVTALIRKIPILKRLLP